VEWRSADTPQAAGRAGRALGGEVALKAVAPDLVHKTEAGGVRVGLHGETTIRRAAERMHDDVVAAGHAAPAFLLQRMAPAGVEMLVGVVQDRHFGPIVACGAGGTAAELLRDVSVRLAPLSADDASEMVRSLTTYPLLDGYRGAPKADVAALEDLLLRISELVDNHPDIAELDCNPVIVGPDGAAVVDMRVRVERGAVSPPSPSLESW
jgi:acyl-CoA synthetase (NDP forming)